MRPAYAELLQRCLAVPAVEGPDKTATLEVAVAPVLRRFEPPTLEELRLVRVFDPRRYFLGEV